MFDMMKKIFKYMYVTSTATLLEWFKYILVAYVSLTQYNTEYIKENRTCNACKFDANEVSVSGERT